MRNVRCACGLGCGGGRGGSNTYGPPYASQQGKKNEDRMLRWRLAAKIRASHFRVTALAPACLPVPPPGAERHRGSLILDPRNWGYVTLLPVDLQLAVRSTVCSILPVPKAHHTRSRNLPQGATWYHKKRRISSCSCCQHCPFWVHFWVHRLRLQEG